MSHRKVKMSRAHAPALEKRSSFTWGPGASLTVTNSFPRVLKYVSFHGVEGVSRVGETLGCEMLFELAHEIVALRFTGKLDCHAALIVRRCSDRCAKVATAESAQPGQCAPAELMHHGCFALRGRRR